MSILDLLPQEAFDQSLLRVLSSAVSIRSNILDGIIEGGVGIISAYAGVGKTQSLLAVCAVVSGQLRVEGLRPQPPRKVLYVVENTDQAQVIIKQMTKEEDYVDNGWLLLARSKRSSAVEVQAYIAEAEKQLTTYYNGIAVPPLLVFDTSNANFDIESENDSAQVGRMLAAIKETKANVWIVSHQAKDDETNKRGPRGSSAWGADTDWSATIVRGAGSNVAIMTTHKTRMVKGGQTIAFEGNYEVEELVDQYGFSSRHYKPWSVIMSINSLGEAYDQNTISASARALQLCEVRPHTRTELQRALGVRKNAAVDDIEGLVKAGKLFSYDAPNQQNKQVTYYTTKGIPRGMCKEQAFRKEQADDPQAAYEYLDNRIT